MLELVWQTRQPGGLAQFSTTLATDYNLSPAWSLRPMIYEAAMLPTSLKIQAIPKPACVWKERHMEIFSPAFPSCSLIVHHWNPRSISSLFYCENHCCSFISKHFVLVRIGVDPWAQGDRMQVHPRRPCKCTFTHNLDTWAATLLDGFLEA